MVRCGSSAASQPAIVGGFANHRKAFAVQRAQPAGHELLRIRRLLQQRALQQPREVRVLRQVRNQAVERGAHLVGAQRARVPRLGEQVDDRPQAALEHGVVQRLLAGEVVVQARSGEAHLARQVAHGDAVDAARGEQPLRGVEDHLARRQRGFRRLAPRARPRRSVLRARGLAIKRTFVRQGEGWALAGVGIAALRQLRKVRFRTRFTKSRTLNRVIQGLMCLRSSTCSRRSGTARAPPPRLGFLDPAAAAASRRTPRSLRAPRRSAATRRTSGSRCAGRWRLRSRFSAVRAPRPGLADPVERLGDRGVELGVRHDAGDEAHGQRVARR